VAGEPLRCRRCQGFQRRVGALAAPGFDQTQLGQPIQEHLERHALQIMSDQAGAEL
jgi:hypothetical protein